MINFVVYLNVILYVAAESIVVYNNYANIFKR